MGFSRQEHWSWLPLPSLLLSLYKPKFQAEDVFCLCCACMLSRFSRVQLFEAPWTVARQAPLSMEFSRQEYWSGLPCLPPGNLPNPGIKPTGGFFITEQPGKPCLCLPALYY